MKTYIAAFFLLLSATFVAAHPYLIQRLGIEQGLSNNYVLSITQDKQGFLWFATEEGLNKFDGTRFITYYKEEQSSSVQSITGNELQSPNQKIPDRKTKCVIKTHINIKQNVIFSAKLKPV